jgi:hypothetical protein
MILRTMLAFGLLIAEFPPAEAQTLSPAEIKAKVDERINGTNEYLKLLNGSDKARNIAAMQIMLTSGDAHLKRIALDYGLYSDDPVVRRAALEGFFSSSPTLEIRIDGSGIEGDTNRERFKNGDISQLGGSITADWHGILSMRVGEFDPKSACWLLEGSKQCLLRLSEDAVSMYLYRKWHSLKLNAEGVLVGYIVPAYVVSPLPASVRVTP